MRKGPIIAAGALILLPTAFALWMGWRALQSDRAGARSNVARAFEARLSDLEARIADFAKATENDLLDATEGLGPDAEKLRALSRDSGLARQAFYIQDGKYSFPPRFGGSQAESDFYQRAQALLSEGDLDKSGGGELDRMRPESGWRSWFYGQGQQFVFWRASISGGILGLELNPSAFLGRLAGILPDSLSEGSTEGQQLFSLVDARGKAFLAWGSYEPKNGEKPVAALSLGEPFQGWELLGYASESGLSGMAKAESWFIALSCIVLALLIGGSAFALTRGFRLELAEARERVSFVNQVSHELKTPLTNIRLYVDLFRGSMKKPDPRQSAYLDVIATESERLTRLIHNVLSFARKDKREAPQPRTLDWDDAVAESLECFKPAFREKGLELAFKPGNSGPVSVDPDWACQIVGNLVSNAEKYASSGKSVTVETGASGGFAWARVADLGPGIPESQAEHVFKPFVRLSHSVNEGVSGSGLGLAISRDLARAHGGDIVLEKRSGPGASFLLRLRDLGGKACES